MLSCIMLHWFEFFNYPLTENPPTINRYRGNPNTALNYSQRHGYCNKCVLTDCHTALK